MQDRRTEDEKASARLLSEDAFNKRNLIHYLKTLLRCCSSLSRVVQTYVMRCSIDWAGGAAGFASGCLFRLINSVSPRAVVNTC